jgi:catechol 2,3-dioxygenase-like lactoylglutathione lyase family enzyme
MIDHIGLPVENYAKSKAFYEKALAPLGISLVMEVTPEMTGGEDSACGFGAAGKPFFWIGPGQRLGNHVHVAFTAANRRQVDAFYKTAIAAGARDNGAPGLRPHYHKDYYGAFVLDLDGHNIEAVCHAPADKS